MNNRTSSDLTFPMLEYAKNETPWDLTPFLYSGGAKAKVKTVRNEITSGVLGDPLLERVELSNSVEKFPGNSVQKFPVAQAFFTAFFRCLKRKESLPVSRISQW